MRYKFPDKIDKIECSDYIANSDASNQFNNSVEHGIIV